MDMPKPDRGLASGIIRAAEEMTDYSVPIVPIMMNLYFAPQVTGMRSYQFGRAVRDVIDTLPARPAYRRCGVGRTVAHPGSARRMAEH